MDKQRLRHLAGLTEAEGEFDRLLRSFGFQLGQLVAKQANGDPEKMKAGLQLYGKKTMKHIQNAIQQVESGNVKLGQK